MKKFTLTLLAAIGMLLFTTTNSNAGVHVGISIGAPGYYYYPPGPYYGYYEPYYGYGRYHYYHHHPRYWRHY